MEKQTRALSDGTPSFFRETTPGLSIIPPGSIAGASVVSGIATKTFGLTQRLRCHQPPRDKTRALSETDPACPSYPPVEPRVSLRFGCAERA